VLRALAPEGGDAGEGVLPSSPASPGGGGVLGDESAIRLLAYDSDDAGMLMA
jgi:hypothetical protein